MSAKAISEYDGKRILAHLLKSDSLREVLSMDSDASSVSGSAFVVKPVARVQLAKLTSATHYQPSVKNNDSNTGSSAASVDRAAIDKQLLDIFENLPNEHPWLQTSALVVKPDQLIKRRGKLGLIGVNLNWDQVKQWISARAGTTIDVQGIKGILKTFIIEPFVPHPDDTEHYISIQSTREGDLILFSLKGGIDVGDVHTHASSFLIPTDEMPKISEIASILFKNVPELKKKVLSAFLARLLAIYASCHFTYLEINPLVVLTTGDTTEIACLDLAAKIDQTAEFEAGKLWLSALPEGLTFPAPFGRELTPEEQFISDLDAKTGASLKLTILNPSGSIWTMVAGGGASVVYSDAIASAGFAGELANYGEYSGAPSESQTYMYASTVLDLMTREMSIGERSLPYAGKILFIGGGIANFTNVATTFKGIIRAIRDFTERLIRTNVQIWVRRGGPNWQEGLEMMHQCGNETGVTMHVYGPSMNVTGIVTCALKGGDVPIEVGRESSVSDMFYGIDNTSNVSLNQPQQTQRANVPVSKPANITPADSPPRKTAATATTASGDESMPFTRSTRAFVYGMQPRAVQGMLDFDFACSREIPSVAAIIYPFSAPHVQKFYWGKKEILIPVYQTLQDALANPSSGSPVDTIVNFASCRSVLTTTLEMLEVSVIKTIAIIAEGVPERHAKSILKKANKLKKLIVGPATVGGIKPGCFKIGNTGGMIDNIIASKLYRPGSVGYVSKSGGMSNELNNLISRCTDGVYEGVAIGGDRYPGSTFLDHLLRFQDDPACKILVLLGEVGGTEEYKVADAIKSGRITKPVVAWCIGTCAGMFGAEVQFGHAGALANDLNETSLEKNKALKNSGAIVPDTFEDFATSLTEVFNKLVEKGTIVVMPEPAPPKIPIDYSWAQELGLIRKPANFVSTICDDRGQELLYAGMPITKVFEDDIGIGGVVSLLWFKRRLPDYACKFIEMVLMLTADHGPAVSGAHNTIVTARAGKDLISSLVSGLLTIGDRFGGALDGAAEQFGGAYEQGLLPQEFVDTMRKKNKLIMGIGHKVKSRTNPDMRVTILTEFAKSTFPRTPVLDYARDVEKITTAKKDNLILNVDGAVATLFVDLLRYSGMFTREEGDEYLKIGTLNGLFVLGRSIGFIGHFLDQKRLKQGLYRHPWDDISYLSEAQ